MATVPVGSPVAAAIEPEPPGLYEVVDGQVVEKPPMGVFEVDIAINLLVALANFARPHRLGQAHSEMLFLIDRSRDLKRRPDVSFVSSSRWSLDLGIPRTSAWDVVPDLVVEVVSPSNTAEAVLAKLEEYFQAGTRLVWVVYPSQAKVYTYESPTTVRILQAGDDLDGGAVLPGFRHSIAGLFKQGSQPAAGE
jgi:Uma2 family endonuclease